MCANGDCAFWLTLGGGQQALKGPDRRAGVGDLPKVSGWVGRNGGGL